MKKNLLMLACVLTTAVQQNLAEQSPSSSAEDVSRDVIGQMRSNGTLVSELTAGSEIGLFALMMQELSVEERKSFYQASFIRQKELEKELEELARKQQWDFEKQNEFYSIVKQNTYFGVACPAETHEVQNAITNKESASQQN